MDSLRTWCASEKRHVSVRRGHWSLELVVKALRSDEKTQRIVINFFEGDVVRSVESDVSASVEDDKDNCTARLVYFQ